MNMTVFQVLLTLRDGPRGASDILDDIQSRGSEGPDSAAPPSLASFYRNLKRAMEMGWLEIADDSAAPRAPGRPGQHYRLTPKGTSAVRIEANRLRDLANLVLAVGPPTKTKSDG